MNKKKQHLFLVLEILMLSSVIINVIPINAESTNDFEIIAKKDDVIYYNYTENGILKEFWKFQVLNITETEDNKTIFYNFFNSTDFNTLNTISDEFNQTLTGNLTNDLFGKHTIASLIIPMGSNFTESKEEVEDNFKQWFETGGNVKIKMTSGYEGYYAKFTMSVKLLFWIQIMEIQCYYSTTGLLLRMDAEFVNPSNFQRANIRLEILPEYTTILGSEEEIRFPTNNSGANDDENQDNLDSNNETDDLTIEEAFAIFITIIISSIVAIVALIIFIRKRRNSKIIDNPKIK